jgi:hypothetical protein
MSTATTAAVVMFSSFRWIQRASNTLLQLSDYLHAAESFLKIQSINSPHFMELECSLPHSNSPLVISLSQINPVQVLPSHFLEIYFKIITPSKPMSFKLPLFFTFPHQNPVHISLLPHTCHMPHPSHSSSFSHSNNIRGGIQIIKLFRVHFPLNPLLLPLTLWHKYLPQHPILEHP